METRLIITHPLVCVNYSQKNLTTSLMLKTPSPVRRRTHDSELKTQKRKPHYQSLAQYSECEKRLRKSINISKHSIQVLRSKDIQLKKLEGKIRKIKKQKTVSRDYKNQCKDKKIVKGSLTKLNDKLNLINHHNTKLRTSICQTKIRLGHLQNQAFQIDQIANLNKEMEFRLKNMLSNKPAVEEAIFDMTPRIAKEVLIVALNK